MLPTVPVAWLVRSTDRAVTLSVSLPVEPSKDSNPPKLVAAALIVSVPVPAAVNAAVMPETAPVTSFFLTVA